MLHVRKSVGVIEEEVRVFDGFLIGDLRGLIVGVDVGDLDGCIEDSIGDFVENNLT